jgi:hypothetical protein
MNLNDNNDSISEEQESLQDVSKLTGELQNCSIDNQTLIYRQSADIITEQPTKHSTAHSTVTNNSAISNKSSASRRSSSKPTSSTALTKRQLGQIRSCMALAKRNWCSLPTIAEHKTSCFVRGDSKNFLRAQSCHSLRGRRYKDSIQTKKTKRIFSYLSQENNGHSPFAPVSAESNTDTRSSFTSPDTTLFLLQDLQLSERTKDSLVNSIKLQHPEKLSSFTPKFGKDSILVPPRRSSSNALLDTSDDNKDSVLVHFETDTPRRNSHDRFASIVSAPTAPKYVLTDGESPFSSCRREMALIPPRIPKRPASPVDP